MGGVVDFGVFGNAFVNRGFEPHRVCYAVHRRRLQCAPLGQFYIRGQDGTAFAILFSVLRYCFFFIIHEMFPAFLLMCLYLGREESLGVRAE